MYLKYTSSTISYFMQCLASNPLIAKAAQESFEADLGCNIHDPKDPDSGRLSVASIPSTTRGHVRPKERADNRPVGRPVDESYAPSPEHAGISSALAVAYTVSMPPRV